jgi:hypothetical protein
VQTILHPLRLRLIEKCSLGFQSLLTCWRACVTDEPVGIAADGDEVYLAAPNLAAAIRALGEIAKVLRLAEEPVEEDDVREGGQLLPMQPPRAVTGVSGGIRGRNGSIASPA